MQAQIYIVRIYRRKPRNGVVGMVEIVRSRERRHFRSFKDLRAILDAEALRWSEARAERVSNRERGSTQVKKEQQE